MILAINSLQSGSSRICTLPATQKSKIMQFLLISCNPPWTACYTSLGSVSQNWEVSDVQQEN